MKKGVLLLMQRGGFKDDYDRIQRDIACTVYLLKKEKEF